MNEFIAYCGLDCETCEARIATVTNDDLLREKVAEEWSKLNNAVITSDMINCRGCRLEGEKTPYCESLCPIRQCAIKKKVDTCGNCNKMNSCELLSMITKNNKDALNNLKKINSQ